MREALGHDASFWITRVVDTITRRIARDDDDIAVSRLELALAAVPWWDGCPRTSALLGRTDHGYRRLPLVEEAAAGYSALLIAWPAKYATPVHDHAGLWGIELVLDGVLEVEAFELAESGEPELVHSHTSLLGIGDSTTFTGRGYAHRCRNRSATAPALSLHVYGGVLDAYRAFRRESRGLWRATPERAAREPALI